MSNIHFPVIRVNPTNFQDHIQSADARHKLILHSPDHEGEQFLAEVERRCNAYGQLISAIEKLQSADHLLQSYQAAKEVGANTPPQVSAHDLREEFNTALGELYDLLNSLSK